ncbi:hypothetical protein MJO29_003843 [Puccinia striiformis f. sp. tritici]|nr:hypothetical protein Pst134EB_008097 [Puccinia striiformis f. sp. tritici]KAI7963416.1 hypothetical protein MJO29_003843 [Puccinia striiformis f. sp. tritici]
MSTFDGYIREFNGLIRVDNFQQSAWLPEGCRPSQVYLLSHAHSDHMVALEKFAGSKIYCSEITRDIVLNIRPVQTRLNQSPGNGIKDLTYRNLHRPSHEEKKDLFETLKPYDPTYVPVNTPDNDQCRITLIPANHCPGSAMFLFQMWGRNVLYTGDIRAEPWWVESLTKESLLAPFVVSPRGINHHLKKPSEGIDHQDGNSLQMTHHQSTSSMEKNLSRPRIRLDNIYLDTSSLLTKIDVLTKEDAINTTIEMMSAYPDDTKFFINAWTWGYEELLQQIIVRFRSLIHVDKYKYGIFKQDRFKSHYPLLSEYITKDSTKTRFHACERKSPCPEVRDHTRKIRPSQSQGSSKTTKGTRSRKALVVCVNPSEITTQNWDKCKASLDLQLAKAKKTKSEHALWPLCLICPLTRHSSFNEILNFLSAFRPKCIFPNTTQPSTGFIEFYAMPKLFGSLLDHETVQRIEDQATQFIKDFEKRYPNKIEKISTSIDSLDWQGKHHRRLTEAFQKFEELEYNSVKYKSMWKDNSEIINLKDREDAARLITGLPLESREIYEIESSSDEEEEFPSDSEKVDLTSETERYQTSETEKAESSETSETQRSEFNDDTPIDTSVEVIRTPDDATSDDSRTDQVTASHSHTSIVSPSTVNEDSRPIQGPSDSQTATNSIESRDSSSSSDQRRSASYWWAVLRDLRLQHYIKITEVSRQLIEYEELLEQLDESDFSDGSPIPKKRTKLIIDNRSERSSSIILIDDPNVDSNSLVLIWSHIRDSIIQLCLIRSKIKSNCIQAIKDIPPFTDPIK